MYYLKIGVVFWVLMILFGGWSFALWHISTVVVDGAIDGYTSIALDGQEYPHISYCSGDVGDLKYTSWTGSYWNTRNVDNADNVGYYNSLALDSSYFPHISYYDLTNGDLKYAYWDGSYWQIQAVDSVGDVGYYTSIAIDAQDHLHISYFDKTNGDLKYAFFDGVSWDIQTVDSSGIVGRYTSLTLDYQNYPHISYFDTTNHSLKYAEWSGSEWQSETVDSAGNVGWFTSIALDSNDYPHISYFDYDNTSLKYAHWNGIAWEIQTVDSEGIAGLFSSIKVNSIDCPHISYFRDYNLCYAFWDGSLWHVSNVEAYGHTGYYTSLALDSLDQPHISYQYNNYDSWSLIYAWTEDYNAISLLSFSATPQGKSVALNWQVESTGGEQVLGFNLYRRERAPAEKSDLTNSNGDQNWQSVNNQLITGQNPYTYTDSGVTSGISYEYRLEAVLADQTKSTLGTCRGTAGLPNAFAITKVYPNPADDYLTCVLSLPRAGEIDLALYDLTGRLVAEDKLEASEPGEVSAQLEVSQLASGVYVATANWGDRQVSKPVIVAH